MGFCRLASGSPTRGCISVHIGKASLVVSGKPQEFAAKLNEIITGM